MRELVKRVLRLLLGNYAAYHIYAIDSRHEVAAQVPEGDSRIEAIDAVDLSASGHAQMRDQSGYCGADAQAFGCWCEGQLVACCIYWYGERYARHRNYWPLALGQAKLVQVITLDSMRGRGLAGRLINHSANAMLGQGFQRLFARIWHSNGPSLRAFERAGWRRASTVFDAMPLGRPLRWVRGERNQIGAGRPND